MKIYLAALLAVFGCTGKVKQPENAARFHISYNDCVAFIATAPNLTQDVSNYYGSKDLTVNMAKAYISHSILQCMRGAKE